MIQTNRGCRSSSCPNASFARCCGLLLFFRQLGERLPWVEGLAITAAQADAGRAAAHVVTGRLDARPSRARSTPRKTVLLYMQYINVRVGVRNGEPVANAWGVGGERTSSNLDQWSQTQVRKFQSSLERCADKVLPNMDKCPLRFREDSARPCVRVCKNDSAALPQRSGTCSPALTDRCCHLLP